MEIFGINGWEMVILVVLGVVILGPERLPEYAAKLAQGVRKLRVLAEGAKVQLKDQLGDDYKDLNWRQYDPRQYDPRRIVREALAEPLDYVAQPFREVRDEVKGITDEVRAIRDGAPAPALESAGAVAAGSAVAADRLGVDRVGADRVEADAVGAASGSRTYWDSEAT